MSTIVSAPQRPAADEFAPYYALYIDLVGSGDVVQLLRTQIADTARLLGALSDEQAAYRYAPGKWSIREVAGHLADAERVFAYRAMRFARGDPTPLPSFDENIFAANASFDSRSLFSIVAEFEAVRAATVAFFETITDDEWGRRGVASNNVMSVRGCAYVIAGHELHHHNVLRTRYL